MCRCRVGGGGRQSRRVLLGFRGGGVGEGVLVVEEEEKEEVMEKVVLGVDGRERGGDICTSINCRALLMAASWRTWFMTAVLGSEEPRESMVVLCIDDVAGRDGSGEWFRGIEVVL